MKLTPTAHMALTMGPLDGGDALDLPDDVLRALWQRYRDRFMDGIRWSELPWGFFEYEGPPELREGRRKLLAVEDPDAAKAQREAREALELRRAKWIAEQQTRSPRRRR